MNANREFWNEQQHKLRALLLHSEQRAAAIDLFLAQHAMVHSAIMAPGHPWSFEDEVLEGLTEAQIRRMSQRKEQSIAWALWHIARTEDVTMNLLLAASPQVFDIGNWGEHLHITRRDIGTAMHGAAIAELSDQIDIPALHGYRVAVGRRTQEIVTQLLLHELRQPVEAERLQAVVAQGALVEDAYEVKAYWGRHPKANLLLMPATRHPFTHLNEALRLRKKWS
ncbi:MAG: DinB family protein [Caldilineaceae bacterium]